MEGQLCCFSTAILNVLWHLLNLLFQLQIITVYFHANSLSLKHLQVVPSTIQRRRTQIATWRIGRYIIIIIIIIIIIVIIINISTALLLSVGRFFSFLILYRIGKAPWTGISPSQGLRLYTQQEQNKHT
jgi:hypothetical protein